VNRGKIALLVVAALVFLSLGFVIGQVVQAVDTLPGSNEDPIATQSYVETAVGERLAVLNTKIEELEAEVAALKGGTTSTNTNSDDNDTTDVPGGNTSGTQVEITGNTVNVRASASTTAAKVGSVTKGTKVTLLKESGDWYQIKLADGTIGWVASYLTKKI
jgi:hypothetical protein